MRALKSLCTWLHVYRTIWKMFSIRNQILNKWPRAYMVCIWKVKGCSKIPSPKPDTWVQDASTHTGVHSNSRGRRKDENREDVFHLWAVALITNHNPSPPFPSHPLVHFRVNFAFPDYLPSSSLHFISSPLLFSFPSLPLSLSSALFYPFQICVS